MNRYSLETSIFDYTQILLVTYVTVTAPHILATDTPAQPGSTQLATYAPSQHP